MGRTLFECNSNNGQVLKMNKHGAHTKLIIFWKTKSGKVQSRAAIVSRTELASLRDAIDDYLSENSEEVDA